MLTSDATLRDEHIDWYHLMIEQATVRVGHGSHDCQVPFVPNETGDMQVFIMNKRITAENAATWVDHYAYR